MAYSTNPNLPKARAIAMQLLAGAAFGYLLTHGITVLRSQ